MFSISHWQITVITPHLSQDKFPLFSSIFPWQNNWTCFLWKETWIILVGLGSESLQHTYDHKSAPPPSYSIATRKLQPAFLICHLRRANSRLDSVTNQSRPSDGYGSWDTFHRNAIVDPREQVHVLDGGAGFWNVILGPLLQRVTFSLFSFTCS